MATSAGATTQAQRQPRSGDPHHRDDGQGPRHVPRGKVGISHAAMEGMESVGVIAQERRIVVDPRIGPVAAKAELQRVLELDGDQQTDTGGKQRQLPASKRPPRAADHERRQSRRRPPLQQPRRKLQPNEQPKTIQIVIVHPVGDRTIDEEVTKRDQKRAKGESRATNGRAASGARSPVIPRRAANWNFTLPQPSCCCLTLRGQARSYQPEGGSRSALGPACPGKSNGMGVKSSRTVRMDSWARARRRDSRIFGRVCAFPFFQSEAEGNERLGAGTGPGR